jgi:hypothetical protein
METVIRRRGRHFFFLRFSKFNKVSQELQWKFPKNRIKITKQLNLLPKTSLLIWLIFNEITEVVFRPSGTVVSPFGLCMTEDTFACCSITNVSEFLQIESTRNGIYN